MSDRATGNAQRTRFTGLENLARTESGKPNGSSEKPGRVCRCRPGTSTWLWGSVETRNIIALERKAALRTRLLSERRETCPSEDPVSRNSDAGERRRRRSVPNAKFRAEHRPVGEQAETRAAWSQFCFWSCLRRQKAAPHSCRGPDARSVTFAVFVALQISSKNPRLPTFIARVAPMWITTPSASWMCPQKKCAG